MIMQTNNITKKIILARCKTANNHLEVFTDIDNYTTTTMIQTGSCSRQ
jgi:hypothetical protein